MSWFFVFLQKLKSQFYRLNFLLFLSVFVEKFRGLRNIIMLDFGESELSLLSFGCGIFWFVIEKGGYQSSYRYWLMYSSATHARLTSLLCGLRLTAAYSVVLTECVNVNVITIMWHIIQITDEIAHFEFSHPNSITNDRKPHIIIRSSESNH